MRSFTRLFVMGLILWTAPAMAQDISPAGGSAGDAGSDTNMQIFMDKVKADKKLLVASNMDLNDAEGKKFWPLYEAYQKDLEKINQRIGATINKYAEAYNQGKGTISNDLAKKLLTEAFSAEEAEVKLKRSYADKITKVLPATKTARYIQIENKIRAIVRVELAKRIPFVTER